MERKKKKENLIETSAVCSTMVERVLCAFFPGLKGQNLLFQGTSSSKDMASAVMKGIDTFVRTHIYMKEKVSKRERKHGFSSYVNGKHISWTSRVFSRLITAG